MLEKGAYTAVLPFEFSSYKLEKCHNGGASQTKQLVLVEMMLAMQKLLYYHLF